MQVNRLIPVHIPPKSATISSAAWELGVLQPNFVSFLFSQSKPAQFSFVLLYRAETSEYKLPKKETLTETYQSERRFPNGRWLRASLNPASGPQKFAHQSS